MKFSKTIFYFLYSITKINKNIVVFESRPDFAEASYFLYVHFLNKKKYKKMFWIANKKNLQFKNSFKINKCIDPKSKNIFYKYYAFYILSKCTLYVYSHSNYLTISKKGQLSLFFIHGSYFKRTYRYIKNTVGDAFLICNTEEQKRLLSNDMGIPKNKILCIQNPRTIPLYKNPSDNVRLIIKNQYSLKSKTYKILLLACSWNQKDAVNNNDTSIFPFYTNIKDLTELNRFLEKNNSFLFIKPHPMTRAISLNEFSNIKLITDLELMKCGINLYDFLSTVDLLISDFSSIIWDFLITKKPIISITTNINEEAAKYNKHDDGGFVFEKPLNYLPEPHVTNYPTFIRSLGDIINNKGDYSYGFPDCYLKIWNKQYSNNIFNKIDSFINSYRNKELTIKNSSKNS